MDKAKDGEIRLDGTWDILRDATNGGKTCKKNL